MVLMHGVRFERKQSSTLVSTAFDTFQHFMHGGFAWMAVHGFYSLIRVLDTLYFNQGHKGFGQIN